jgi:hypothetical protein
MTPVQRIFLGAIGSFLLLLGFVKTAESFDPVLSGRAFGGPGGDPVGGAAARE